MKEHKNEFYFIQLPGPQMILIFFLECGNGYTILCPKVVLSFFRFRIFSVLKTIRAFPDTDFISKNSCRYFSEFQSGFRFGFN